MPGHACQCLLARQTEEPRGHAHRQEEGGARRRSRIAVRRDGHAGAGLTQGCNGRLALLRQAEKGHGQQYRHRARRGQRLGLQGGRILQVIGRQRAAAGRQEAAAKVGELLRVHFHGHAETARRVEEPLRLCHAESHALAENIDGIHEPFLV